MRKKNHQNTLYLFNIKQNADKAEFIALSAIQVKEKLSTARAKC